MRHVESPLSEAPYLLQPRDTTLTRARSGLRRHLRVAAAGRRLDLSPTEGLSALTLVRLWHRRFGESVELGRNQARRGGTLRRAVAPPPCGASRTAPATCYLREIALEEMRSRPPRPPPRPVDRRRLRTVGRPAERTRCHPARGRRPTAVCETAARYACAASRDGLERSAPGRHERQRRRSRARRLEFARRPATPFDAPSCDELRRRSREPPDARRQLEPRRPGGKGRIRRRAVHRRGEPLSRDRARNLLFPDRVAHMGGQRALCPAGRRRARRVRRHDLSAPRGDGGPFRSQLGGRILPDGPRRRPRRLDVVEALPEDRIEGWASWARYLAGGYGHRSEGDDPLRPR